MPLKFLLNETCVSFKREKLRLNKANPRLGKIKPDAEIKVASGRKNARFRKDKKAW